MSNVVQLNARKARQNPNACRVEVHGVERGHRILLWQDRYQRLWLEVSQCGQVVFRMEPVGHVN